MSESYLEVTYRRGRAFAAYLYLPRRPGQKSHRTRCVEPGLVIDLTRSGQAIGIEITAPGKVSVAQLNRLLKELGVPPLKRGDLAPLKAA
jgi:uncharacterized protein YuzE